MLLSDLGADVVTVSRVGGDGTAPSAMSRGRRSVAVDLKKTRGVDVALRLVESADVLMEGFRPGVTERLGLGPDVCAQANGRLVYARMTGFGQDGPLAAAPGHDINFIALAGILGAIGHAGVPPPPPLNLIGDYGGGGMLLVVGVLAALWHARATGAGQVVDVAMLDGSASLMSSAYAATDGGGPRGTNTLDGGAPFYCAYATSDDRYVAVGAVEPQFYRALASALGFDPADLPPQWDRATWPVVKEAFASVFRTRTREEWSRALEGTDACLSPVLEVDEVASHHHVRRRGVLVERDGVTQPRPTPRFSRTPLVLPAGPPASGQHTEEVLSAHGFSSDVISELRAHQVVG